jgi:ribonuclease BN (tRNA processing enzyme)
MTLTVLGCDGSWPGPGGAGSGYLVTVGRTRLLLDAGPGVFAVLQTVMDPADLDAVLISHHHPDHWTDLNGLATHARFALHRPAIDVFAPERVPEQSRLRSNEALAWHAVADGDTVEVGEARATFHRTDHVPDTLAVRVEGGGRALGYSADSGPRWPLAALGTGLDLVLCEATYTEEHEGVAQHMSGRQAGEQARQAEARRLVITHRWPTIDAGAVAREAERSFGAPIEQAASGKEFDV